MPAICMTEEKKEAFEDDGRTICNMDVDGMPQSMFHVTRGNIEKKRYQRNSFDEESMTRSEYRRYTWYAVLAGLSVVGVVGGGTVLFVFILWLLWR